MKKIKVQMVVVEDSEDSSYESGHPLKEIATVHADNSAEVFNFLLTAIYNKFKEQVTYMLQCSICQEWHKQPEAKLMTRGYGHVCFPCAAKEKMETK